jgi:hypothetical protein
MDKNDSTDSDGEERILIEDRSGLQTYSSNKKRKQINDLKSELSLPSKKQRLLTIPATAITYDHEKPMDLNALLNQPLPFEEISPNDLIQLYFLGGDVPLLRVLKLLTILTTEPGGEAVTSHKLYNTLQKTSQFFGSWWELRSAYERQKPGSLDWTIDTYPLALLPSQLRGPSIAQKYKIWLGNLERDLVSWFVEFEVPIPVSSPRAGSITVTSLSR